MRKLRVLTMVAAVVLALTGCGSSSPDRIEAGDPALGFTATTVEGDEFNGADLAGRPTVLWFWAGWCPSCRAAAPTVKEAAEKFGDRANIVGVAGMSSNSAPMRKFIADTGLTGITHLFDEYDPLWERFEITLQDQYVIIDEEGTLRYRGKLGEQELTSRLTALTS